MLYDDSEHLEVRHVISLEYHDVDIYGGGEVIPEGELFIKRNCVRLRRSRIEDDTSEAKPFYFFSENGSEKEDFYHAMLQSKERIQKASDNPPKPLYFDQPDIMKLVRQLHTSEEDLQTRWLNALIGRVFLSLYKTGNLADFVGMKITKKIARVRKPALVSSIKLQRIAMGDSAPTITNPKLKELNVNGDLTVEADINYNGNFRLEIAAVARIELGSRFKPRQVNLILAGILKQLEGHILIRIKPPPSNRIWISFEIMPKIEMSIEPIVSSRQITYGIILRAIESRIREVISETIVHPNWDDIPFTNTMLQRFRGGIWADESKGTAPPGYQTVGAEQGLADHVDKDTESEDEAVPVPDLGPEERTMSMPDLLGLTASELRSRNAPNAGLFLDGSGATGASSSPQSQPSSDKPKAMRSNSFASAAPAVVSIDPAIVDATKDRAKGAHQDAVSAMKIISSRSQPASPTDSPVGSPPQPSFMTQAKKESFSSISTKGSQGDISAEDDTVSALSDEPRRDSEAASINSTDISSARTSTKSKAVRSLQAGRSLTSVEKRAGLNQSIGSATAAAKKWGWGVLNKSSDHPLQSQTTTDKSHLPGSPSQPIGRGQPLPPPGTPLPPPERPSGWTSSLNITKRKPIPSAPVKATHPSATPPSKLPRPRSPSPRAPPLPARHKRPTSKAGGGVLPQGDGQVGADELMVVAAPAESQPASPAVENESPPLQTTEGIVEGSDRPTGEKKGQGWNARLTRNDKSTERNERMTPDTNGDMDSLKLLEATAAGQ